MRIHGALFLIAQETGLHVPTTTNKTKIPTSKLSAAAGPLQHSHGELKLSLADSKIPRTSCDGRRLENLPNLTASTSCGVGHNSFMRESCASELSMKAAEIFSLSFIFPDFLFRSKQFQRPNLCSSRLNIIN